MAIQSSLILVAAWSWAKAFGLTQLIEAPIYRTLVPARWSYALGASAVTHPFVWFAFPALDLDWTTTGILSEIFAVTVEAIFFRRFARSRWTRAVLVSLLANGASVAIGLFLRSRYDLV